MLPIEINIMTASDVDLLTNCLETDFDDFWSIQNLKSELESPNSKCFVAKNENNIVGFASIWFGYDDVHLMNIVTHKNFRNRGIAKKLLEHIIASIDDQSFTLEVRNSNIVAIKLYQQFGFKKVGIRKNYYTHNNKTEDGIIMTRKI